MQGTFEITVTFLLNYINWYIFVWLVYNSVWSVFPSVFPIPSLEMTLSLPSHVTAKCELHWECHDNLQASALKFYLGCGNKNYHC